MKLWILIALIGCISLLPFIHTNAIESGNESPGFVSLPDCVGLKIYLPLCGTDNNNYLNLSFFNCSKELNPDLEVLHEGLCTTSNNQQSTKPMQVKPPLSPHQPPVSSSLPPISPNQPPVHSSQTPLSPYQPPVPSSQNPLSPYQPPTPSSQTPLSPYQPPIPSSQTPLSPYQPPVTSNEYLPPVPSSQTPLSPYQPPVTSIEYLPPLPQDPLPTRIISTIIQKFKERKNEDFENDEDEFD